VSLETEGLFLLKIAFVWQTEGSIYIAISSIWKCWGWLKTTPKELL